MPFQRSDQDDFAANLQGKSWGGTAVYEPFQFLPHKGRVGDIAFFDSRGKYIWLHNAFHTEVYPRFSAKCPTNRQDLRRLNWPEFTANENQVLTQTTHHDGCRLAVGGSVIMTKKEFEVGGTAPLAPG